jgi:hypothetical protein
MLTLVPPASAEGDGASKTSGASAGERAVEEGPAAEEAPPPESASGVPESASDASGSGEVGGPPTADDPVAAARDLLDRRAACFAALDLRCLGTVVQPGSAIEASDRAALAAAREGEAVAPTVFDPATVEVVAEMGGAVLVRARVAPEREPASLLMVRGEAGWRLREVFD